MSRGTLDTPPPAFGADEAGDILRLQFGVEGRLQPLVSERDQNFAARAVDGRRYVLKFANPAEDPGVVDFQVRALQHVECTDNALPLPRIVSARDGRSVVALQTPAGRPCLARLVTWLDGVPMDRSQAASDRRLTAMGTTLARLGRGLRGFFHPAARHELLWDLKNAGRLRHYLEHIPEPADRQRVAAVLDGFDAVAAPVLPALRAQVIHNDFNPDNVLGDENDADRIAGVIDFGDLVHSPLIVDLAVAAAYQLGENGDPLQPVLRLLSAYHRVTRLEPAELDVLYDLIVTRVATTVAISSWRAARYPENRDYIFASNPRALRLLKKLAGVSRDTAAKRFRDVCGLPTAVATVPAPGRASLLMRRDKLLGPAYRLFYDRPLHLVRGEGVWLYDTAGEAYLDVYNNVPHVGHCHPRVVGAVSRQMARLNTHTRYLHENILDYAERLGSLLPFPDPVCLFCCTGSEANELAYRIAQAHTGGTGVIVTDHAYHGNSNTVAQFSTADTPVEHRGDFVQAVEAPDRFRGTAAHGADGLADYFSGQVADALQSMAKLDIRPAMMLIDTIHSCDGIVGAPRGYLAQAAAHLRDAGGLLVADEVQAGFGRTGERLWGFERHHVVPDIVTLGKPMGNGFPLAAVVTNRSIVEAFAGQIDYFNTFGGNPVACAAGLAVLDVLEAEGLQANAQRVGEYLMDALRELQRDHELIGDVRGAGLFIGIELVRDRDTLAPATAEARGIVNALRERKILIGATGPRGNVLKLRPPMPFSMANADRLLDELKAVLV